MNDSDFDSAWRAFAEADARERAPDRIREAVLAQWDTPREVHPTVRSHRPQVVRATLAVAATLAITTALFQLRASREPARDPEASASRAAARSVEEPDRLATVANPDSTRFAPRRARRPRNAVRQVTPTETSSAGASTPLVSLTGEPALAAEPLQLVRLRVPRTSLRAFGVALIDPDASGLVDVDLIVGSDGLPRDIRRVRPVVDVRDQPMESP
jgi:hypothetical protein